MERNIDRPKDETRRMAKKKSEILPIGIVVFKALVGC